MNQPPTAERNNKRITYYALRIIPAILFIYGALGVFIQLRFVAVVIAAFSLLFGQTSFTQPPPEISALDPLWSHFAAEPALPWLAWLIGLGLLLLGNRSRRGPVVAIEHIGALPDAAKGKRGPLLWLAGAAVVLLALGAYARLDLLVPQSVGISEYPFDDEGVYAGASQLFLQGILPYRDYFFAHPPLAAMVYAPAMAYHFTAWGSATSFMIARYLSVGYSLLALLGFLLLGFELGGRGLRGVLAGATAAAVWAIDGRAIEINQKVMLDQPMLLFSLLSLLLFLLYLRGQNAGAGAVARFLTGRPALILALAGLLAAASSLTKIQGVACFMALFADLLLRTVFARPIGKVLPHLLALLAGFIAGVVVIAGPFLLAAPNSFIRMIIFFQLLRPSDGVVAASDRIANLSMDLRNGVTLLLAVCGFVTLTVWLWRLYQPGVADDHVQKRRATLWTPVLLWAFFNVLLFTYSRSFYGHYYTQLSAPLCLLAAGVWLSPLRVKLLPVAALIRQRTAVALVAPIIALLIALPLAAAAWQGFTSRHEDRIFEIVSRYISDAVPPGSPVLSTDEQFNLLAARPPSHDGTGYLVDSYGHLIYLGLGLGDKSYGDLIAAIRGPHPDDPDPIMHAATPQQDLLTRAQQAALIVVHYNQGARRLTADTLQKFMDLGASCSPPQIEKQSRYLVIRVCGK